MKDEELEKHGRGCCELPRCMTIDFGSSLNLILVCAKPLER